ncbi:hypothetical protein AVEN_185498-1 [Araneus ventricosus]|uniref:Uncharacterized protein n=1 Tax=Araneus ventricosus TaxID=182803 RepID=A0A4Y2G930_ARAVE|nr:hypothetical protein AVEN_185498-1 [Araneus ventricosus]
MFIIRYPPPDIGNSFCLVVRMFGSGSKSPQFYPRTATVVTRKNTQHLLSVPLLDGSTTNSIYFYIHQMAAPPIPSTFTSTKWQHLNFYTKLYQIQKSMTISQHKVCDLHLPAHTHKLEVTICAYARSTLIASLIFR